MSAARLRPIRYAALAALIALAGCAPGPTPLPSPPAPAASSSPASATPTPATCSDALVSYAPPATLPRPGAMPRGSTMAAIAERGRLVVGISADTYLFSSRNPLTGRIEGFDIDLIRAIAAALLGSPDRVEYRVITAAQRIPSLTSHQVDLVVRTFTMNCDRWQDVAFSAEYYQAGQKLLVRKGSAITRVDTLGGHTVCAPKGTSSLATIAALEPTAVLIPADTHTGCLVKFQRAEVEAITGDDTVLAGLAAQDPYAVVLRTKAFTSEPYGVGIPKDKVDLARFVNGVLAAYVKDGSWTRSYDHWLAPSLGKAPAPPVARYGRTS